MEESDNVRRYFVDLEAASNRGRSMSVLIAERRCYACRQEDSEESLETSDPKDYIARISKQCTDTSDYLLPDTPLKEAIFRVILAGKNEPVSAEEVSEALSTRWAMTANSRDITPGVISKLLEHSESYSIAALPEPEPEEPEEPEEETAPVEELPEATEEIAEGALSEAEPTEAEPAEAQPSEGAAPDPELAEEPPQQPEPTEEDTAQ